MSKITLKEYKKYGDLKKEDERLARIAIDMTNKLAEEENTRYTATRPSDVDPYYVTWTRAMMNRLRNLFTSGGGEIKESILPDDGVIFAYVEGDEDPAGMVLHADYDYYVTSNIDKLRDKSRSVMYLYVRPDHRGKGIGEELMRRVSGKGFCKLTVDPLNEPAIKLYDKIGYTVDVSRWVTTTNRYNNIWTNKSTHEYEPVKGNINDITFLKWSKKHYSLEQRILMLGCGKNLRVFHNVSIDDYIAVSYVESVKGIRIFIGTNVSDIDGSIKAIGDIVNYLSNYNIVLLFLLFGKKIIDRSVCFKLERLDWYPSFDTMVKKVK